MRSKAFMRSRGPQALNDSGARGLGYFMVDQESDKDHCREPPSGTKIDRVPTMSRHESPVTSTLVAAFPSECYDLVFHDPC